MSPPGPIRCVRTSARKRCADTEAPACDGMGWRSYDYAGHHIVGHRGGVAGYRSLILFDPQRKSGVVALWNSNTSQPGGLEFEVMDMLYHLPFRDWMELDSRKAAPIAVSPPADEVSGESAR